MMMSLLLFALLITASDAFNPQQTHALRQLPRSVFVLSNTAAPRAPTFLPRPIDTTTTTTRLSAIPPSAFLSPRASKIVMLIFVFGVIRKYIKKGSVLSPGGSDEPNWKYVTTGVEQEKELKAFSCAKCQYVASEAKLWERSEE